MITFIDTALKKYKIDIFQTMRPSPRSTQHTNTEIKLEMNNHKNLENTQIFGK